MAEVQRVLPVAKPAPLACFRPRLCGNARGPTGCRILALCMTWLASHAALEALFARGWTSAGSLRRSGLTLSFLGIRLSEAEYLFGLASDEGLKHGLAVQ